jgi:hypothetical protein
MIRIIYWLIKRRWSVCKKCKHYKFVDLPRLPRMNSGIDFKDCNHECTKYRWAESGDYVRGLPEKIKNDFCIEHNKNGCCWGFKPKLKNDYIEPPEPWPRY